MQTAITQRPRPQHRGNESAAIALTAQLLSSLKTGAAGAAYQTQIAGAPRYSGEPCTVVNAPSVGTYFSRLYDSKYCTWFGIESRLDQHGRQWRRHFEAVIDDFGNLVEVPA